MVAKQLFDEGKLEEAEKALAAHLRDRPNDDAARRFLFELLCFTGQLDRAEKHLAVLADRSADARLGGLLYVAAIAAARTRDDMFRAGSFPSTPAAGSGPGLLNGQPFQSLRDADPAIGPRLEIFGAGDYFWIPLEHVRSIQMERPKLLRDLLWRPAKLLMAASFKGQDFGEVLIPVVYPFSYKNGDPALTLGRATEWVADDDGAEFPVGQKLLVADGQEIPFLEVESIEFPSHEERSE